MKDFNSFGLFYEDFAVRDLRVYAECLGGAYKRDDGVYVAPINLLKP